MKLPSSVGQKKIKALEQMLLELGVGECKGWAPQNGPPEAVDKGGGGQFLWPASQRMLALPLCLPPAHLQS